MFSKFRQLNGLIFNTARRTYSIYSTVYSGNPNMSRTENLLKPTCPYRHRQARSPSTFEVNKNRGQFYIDVEGMQAVLLFSIHKQVMTIWSTQVPEELSGRGLGKLLAKSALDFALLNGYFLNVKCGFVKHYIEKYHPQYAQYML